MYVYSYMYFDLCVYIFSTGDCRHTAPTFYYKSGRPCELSGGQTGPPYTQPQFRGVIALRMCVGRNVLMQAA